MLTRLYAEDYARCLVAGMSGFIPKPVNPYVLYATLLLWLSVCS